MKPEADPRLKKAFSRIGTPEDAPFVPDPFQEEAVTAIRESDCLVTAPTGSGKTWIAVQAIAQMLEEGKKSWYASPLKALSNAKFLEFCEEFGEENVGILTGDRKLNPDAPVVVGTTEILRNQLYDCMHEGTDLGSDLIVLDEAHYLGDPDRGVVWEETIIYLPQRVPLLLLSATIGNAADIAGWMESIRGRTCRVVAETRRPVPLTLLFLHPSGRLIPLREAKGGGKGEPLLDKKVRSYLSDKKSPRLPTPRGLPPMGEILKVLAGFNLLPAIFFLKSRKDCDRALTLCPPVLRNNPARRERVEKALNTLTGTDSFLSRHRQRRHMTSSAVASHHSGQLPAWKLVVEGMMDRGLLDAVFATSTVAAGVNFPARTVVLFQSDRFNGAEFLPLTATEFHQMTGRAGRRGKDAIGFALVVPGPYMDLKEIAAVSRAKPTPVLSQIRVDFSMVLNLLLSHTPKDVRLLLKKSFAAYLLSSGGKRARKAEGDIPDGRALWRDFIRRVEFLKELGFVDPEERPTEDGQWAARLRVDQPLMIAQGLKQDLFPTDPAILAALVAVFVQDKELDVYLARDFVPPDLEAAYLNMIEHLRPLAQAKADRGFDVKPVDMWPAATVFAWVSGRPWEDTLRVAGMAEGDLAMLISRTAENLRQIAGLGEVFPSVAQTAKEAIHKLLREPVTAPPEAEG